MSATRRIVIAGLGDTGVLSAIHLAQRSDVEVVGIGAKSCLVSGQELGLRLTRPERWKRDYLLRFARYRKLDAVRTVHGAISQVDPVTRSVVIVDADGRTTREPYDVLVVATGVTQGFWRNATLQSEREIEAELSDQAARVAAAKSFAVVGGGASGVSVAANVKRRFPEKEVHLFHPHEEPLREYHPKIRGRLVARLAALGVERHPHHRALLPDGIEAPFSSEPVLFETGQPAFASDLVLWCVGRARPNADFLPDAWRDDAGFVRVDASLRVASAEGVFALGDVAATDPQRSSARNWGHRVLTHNVGAFLDGQPEGMKRYRPPAHRWGSILGPQHDGLEVFQPNGGRYRIPAWIVDRVITPWVVNRAIYRGVRKPEADADR
ncbi:MAG: FAD-dependent oxidoreductase [Myxococcota bacterium]